MYKRRVFLDNDRALVAEVSGDDGMIVAELEVFGKGTEHAELLFEVTNDTDELRQAVKKLQRLQHEITGVVNALNQAIADRERVDEAA